MKITVRRLPNQPETDATGCFDVVFGEGDDAIFIMVRGGNVEASARRGQLIVKPRSANVVWIVREEF